MSLSDKIMDVDFPQSGLGGEVVTIEDVKEFIKELKERFPEDITIIDELAGPKLTEGGKNGKI